MIHTIAYEYDHMNVALWTRATWKHQYFGLVQHQSGLIMIWLYFWV